MAWPMSLLSGACADTPPAPAPDAGADARECARAEGKPRPKAAVSLPVKELLRHFESPGVPPPPSARVGDPKLKQRESQPFRLLDLWKYGAFAATKGAWGCGASLGWRAC